MKHKKFYINTLDLKTNTLKRLEGTMNYDYPDGVTIDVCCHDQDTIIIGVTDEREVFSQDDTGRWDPI